MFDPECLNIECPQCLLGKIYFDCQMGYYCMLCGREFSAVETEVLVEKDVSSAHPAKKSETSRKKPAGEIRELPARKAKEEHVGPHVIKHETPEK